MFFGQSKEIARLRSENQALQARISSTESDRDTLQQHATVLQAQVASLNSRVEVKAGIFHCMQSFDRSFGAFQSALFNLASTFKEEKQSALSAAHTSCRLGKWYFEGDGRDCFLQVPGYREIEPPHVAVHKHGVAAIEDYLAGRQDWALKNIQQMKDASMAGVAGTRQHGLERRA